jgi:CRP-like cAMP-binding protein
VPSLCHRRAPEPTPNQIFPSIAQRVPQSMLASYLGMTPETVSRIRRNLSRR